MWSRLNDDGWLYVHPVVGFLLDLVVWQSLDCLTTNTDHLIGLIDYVDHTQVSVSVDV